MKRIALFDGNYPLNISEEESLLNDAGFIAARYSSLDEFLASKSDESVPDLVLVRDCVFDPVKQDKWSVIASFLKDGNLGGVPLIVYGEREYRLLELPVDRLNKVVPENPRNGEALCVRLWNAKGPGKNGHHVPEQRSYFEAVVLPYVLKILPRRTVATATNSVPRQTPQTDLVLG